MAVEMWKMQAFQPSLQTYREMIGQWPFSSLHISLYNISKIVLCALWNNLRKSSLASPGDRLYQIRQCNYHTKKDSAVGML
jgi:hypothetical protein